MQARAISNASRYRYEFVNVYGTTIKELIHQEFGDGIMSAIDFSLDIQREPNADDDRVHVVLSGKLLPYARRIDRFIRPGRAA